MLHILADVLAAGLVIGFAVAGLARGFVKTFFGLFGFLIAIGVALFFAAPLAEILKQYIVEPALSEFFLKRLSEETLVSTAEIDFSSLPAGAVALFSRFGVSAAEVAQKVMEAGCASGQDLALSLAERAVSGVADLLSRAAAFLLIFALASVLIAVLANVLDLVAKTPGLKTPNRITGFLVGALEGLSLAFVYSLTLSLIEPILQGSESAWLRDFSVDHTVLVRFLSGWNPLMIPLS